MLLMGKSTISMAIFNSFFFNQMGIFQKVPPIKRTLTWHLHGQNDAASWVHEKKAESCGMGCGMYQSGFIPLSNWLPWLGSSPNPAYPIYH